MSVGGAVLTLKRPRAADRPRVRAMVEATGAFRPSELAIALEVFDEAVAGPGRDYWAIGAYEDDRLVGYTAYGATPGTEDTWDLYWIVVDPAAQRQGTGRRLMAATEDAVRAAGGRLMVVETSSRPDYAPTRAFYAALSYVPAARIPDYYAPRDALIVFTKHLAPPTETTDHG